MNRYDILFTNSSLYQFYLVYLFSLYYLLWSNPELLNHTKSHQLYLQAHFLFSNSGS